MKFSEPPSKRINANYMENTWIYILFVILKWAVHCTSLWEKKTFLYPVFILGVVVHFGPFIIQIEQVMFIVSRWKLPRHFFQYVLHTREFVYDFCVDSCKMEAKLCFILCDVTTWNNSVALNIKETGGGGENLICLRDKVDNEFCILVSETPKHWGAKTM